MMYNIFRHFLSFSLFLHFMPPNNGCSFRFLYEYLHFYIDNGMRNIFIDKRMTNYRDENKERETYLLGEKVVMIKHDHDFVIMFTMISLYKARLLWLKAQVYHKYDDKCCHFKISWIYKFFQQNTELQKWRYIKLLSSIGFWRSA